VKVLIHSVPAGAAAGAPASRPWLAGTRPAGTAATPPLRIARPGISRPEITGTLVQRAESRSSNSAGWLRLPRGRAFWPAPARYVSGSRVDAADASRPVKADNRDRISGLRRHILPAMHTLAIAGVPGPGSGRRQPGSYAPRCIPAGSSAWPAESALTAVARGTSTGCLLVIGKVALLTAGKAYRPVG
jgi:hypothetical protein